MESDIDSLRNKLDGLAGTQLEDEQIAELLSEVLGSGGGVTIELDLVRYKLIRRDGRFVLSKDPTRARSSSMPPRR